MQPSDGGPEPTASEVMSRLLFRVLLPCSLLSGKMAWLFLRQEGTSHWLMSAALSSRLLKPPRWSSSLDSHNLAVHFGKAAGGR